MSRHLHRMLEEQQRMRMQQEIVEKPSVDEKEYVSTGDDIKMNWKKIDFLDAIDKWVYSDEHGYCYHRLENVSITIPKLNDGRTEVGLNELYVYCEDGKCKRFSDLKIENIFKNRYGIYINNNYGYYGGRPEIISQSQITELKPKKFNLGFRVNYYCGNDNWLNISANKIEDIENKKFYYNPEKNDTVCQPVLINSLSEGKQLYLLGVGTVTVDKVFDYPSADEVICSIKDLSGNTKKVLYNSQTDDGFSVSELPMNIGEKEIAVFNKSLNELSLQPFVINEGQTYNIYWQGLKDAAQYVVEIYKIIDHQTKKKIYHLNDFYIDRTTNYLSVNNLVGKNFVFVVKAENRDGEALAFSRGMSNGEPKWW